MASTNIQTFPGKVGVSNTNPIHTLDIGSNVYIEDTADTKFRVYGNIHASGITVDGSITVIETDNLSVKDPVLLLAAGSTGTSDTGIIMKRSDGDSNVAIFYDEGVGLKLGHTMSSGDDIHLSVDTANALATSVYGPVNVVNSGTQALSVDGGAQVDGNFQVGVVSNLFVDTATSNVGIGTTSPAYKLEVDGKVGIQDELKVAYDADTASYIGRAAVGYMGQSDQASFSHVDKNTSANFALKQAASGATHVNTPTGQHIRFSVNASEVGRFTGGGDFEVGTSASTKKLIVDTSASEVQMYSQATGSTAGPDLVLRRDNGSGVGSNNEYIGQIRYEGLSDTGNSLLYAKTTGKIKTATNGSEDGVIETMIKTGGSNRISVRHSGAKFLIQKGTDLQVGEVANLYVDTSTSRVGIGMSNPSYTLDVDGDINLSTGSTLKINGTDAVFSNWTASGSDIYRSSGNVGIGTTDADYKLHIRSGTATALLLESDNGGTGYPVNIDFRNYDAQDPPGARISVIDDADYGSDITFNTKTGSPGTGSLSQRMIIQGDGNVGIGTTSPDTDLHIYGSTSQTNIFLGETGTPDKAGIIKYYQGDNSSNPGRLAFGSWGDNFSTGASTMCIKKGGNVGIGTTNPTHQLHIGPKDNDHIYLASSNNSYGWTIDTDDQGSGTVPFRIIKRTGGVDSTVLTIKNQDGNVGIGTTSPNGNLHIMSDLANASSQINPSAQLVLHSSLAGLDDDGDIGASLVFTQRWLDSSPNSHGTMGSIHGFKDLSAGNYGGGLLFKTQPGSDTAPVERMRIDRDGNVGIGLTNPTYDLDVRGGLAVSYADNNAMKIDGGGTLRRHYTGSGNNYGAGLHFTNDAIWPTNYAGSYVNNQIDLGNSNYKWKGVHTEYLACGGSGAVPATFTSSQTWQTSVNIGNSTVPSNTWSFILGGSGNNTGAAGVGSLGFYVNNGNGFVMNLNAGGNVGIGTTNPGYKLDVNGTSYYRSRMYLHQSGSGGGQNLFTGLDGATSANGRAQFVLSSAYSDLVIASSQGNNVHGSTLSFVTYNTSNSGDYRKFVINQGNWGSRKQFLEFGYADASRTNPHGYINSADTVLTLDGYNKRVGIRNTNPSYKLDVGGDVRGDMFIANNPSSGDGDDYAIGSLENDYSAWINIFNNAWISGQNGWGTFWAGNSGARYRRVSSDSNPNEYVFVGGGSKRCTFDLDNGHVYLDGNIYQNNYDYAEFFEWEDGNPENEDRRGYSVVLASGGKIRKATSDDSPEDIIGVVSGTAGIIGDAAMYDWDGKYEVDEWGTRVKDKVYQLTWEVELENGEKQNHSYDEDRVPEGIIVPENASRRLRSRERINPEYDETRIYEPRDKRKEWSTIGLLGKVRVRDESPKHPNWKYLKTIAGKKLWLIK